MKKIDRRGIKDMILKQLQAQGRMMPQPKNHNGSIYQFYLLNQSVKDNNL